MTENNIRLPAALNELLAVCQVCLPRLEAALEDRTLGTRLIAPIVKTQVGMMEIQVLVQRHILRITES